MGRGQLYEAPNWGPYNEFVRRAGEIGVSACHLWPLPEDGEYEGFDFIPGERVVITERSTVNDLPDEITAKLELLDPLNPPHPANVIATTTPMNPDGQQVKTSYYGIWSAGGPTNNEKSHYHHRGHYGIWCLLGAVSV